MIVTCLIQAVHKLLTSRRYISVLRHVTHSQSTGYRWLQYSSSPLELYHLIKTISSLGINPKVRCLLFHKILKHFHPPHTLITYFP